jgi:hypothetical protein
MIVVTNNMFIPDELEHHANCHGLSDMDKYGQVNLKFILCCSTSGPIYQSLDDSTQHHWQGNQNGE